MGGDSDDESRQTISAAQLLSMGSCSAEEIGQADPHTCMRDGLVTAMVVTASLGRASGATGWSSARSSAISNLLVARRWSSAATRPAPLRRGPRRLLLTPSVSPEHPLAQRHGGSKGEAPRRRRERWRAWLDLSGVAEL